VCLLGLLGLRIFEATGTNITDLGEEHGHRVLRVVGKGDKTVLIPLSPAVGRVLDSAIGDRTSGRSCSTAAVSEWTGTPLTPHRSSERDQSPFQVFQSRRR
jgi:hypothetical protein